MKGLNIIMSEPQKNSNTNYQHYEKNNGTIIDFLVFTRFGAFWV